MRKAILVMLAALLVVSMSACGGGGNTPPPPPSVTISPATANVQEGSQQQFTATVANTDQTAVTWQVNGVTGGNSSVGTIDSNGIYTAPVVVPSPGSVTISAFLNAAPSIAGSSIVTITAVTFNNSSLKGNYVFSITGVDAGGFTFYAVGAITADGNGNVTAGEEDLNDATNGYFQATSTNGTYVINADGRGTISLNNSIGQFQFAVAMKALNNAVLNEIDGSVVAATGSLEAQAASPAAPSGNYAFGFQGIASGCNAGLSSAGIFNMNGGTLGGVQDVNCSGSITNAETLNGSFGSIDGLGRGTGSFSASTGSSNLIYYVVSGNRFRYLCPDNAVLFMGSADLQTQNSFSNADVNGNYVISSSANTQAGISYTLIQFNASGGHASSGYYDVNDTGTVGQAQLTGSFSVGSNGYVSGTWNVNNVGLPFGMYMVSPTQAYYVDERTTAVGGGNAYSQGSSVTSNSDWAGSYANKQFGYFLTAGVINSQNASAISGQISADGNGILAGTLDVNDPGGITLGATLQGTYSVGNVAPGRTTVQISNAAEQGNRNYVAYIVDQGRVLMLETDTNITSSGDSIRQF